jgi:hypothetical protein
LLFLSATGRFLVPQPVARARSAGKYGLRRRDRPVSAAAYAHESWSLRLADAWGHHSPELLSASVLAAIVVGLRPPPGAFALTVPVALLLFVLGSWVMMRRHDRRLCEQCAAAIPLNATEQAARSNRRIPAPNAAS